MSSAGNTRGLIEVLSAAVVLLVICLSSAGNTRGLIEVWSLPTCASPPSSLSSAGNTRGLIEVSAAIARHRNSPLVFRGEYPRPH